MQQITQQHSKDGSRPSAQANPVRNMTAVRLFSLAVAAVVLAALIAGVYYLYVSSTQKYQQLVREDTHRELGLVTARLEGNIKGNIQTAKALVAAINARPDMDQEYFSDYAAPLFDGDVQLRNVGATQDLKMRFVYPLKGNEGVVGIDFRQLPDQVGALIQARQTGRPVLAGPVNLVQGGRGLIARIPVYVSRDSEKAFWGTISAVIDFEKLLRDSGLSDLNLPLNIAIRKPASIGGPSGWIYGDPTVFDASSQAVTWNVGLNYNTQWELAATPKDGWPAAAPEADVLLIFSGGIAALIFGGVLLLLRSFRKQQESNALLRSVFDLAPMGIALNDFESGQFIQFNDELCRATGYSREELQVLDYWKLTPAEYDDQEQDQLRQLDTQGRYGPYEKEYIHKDGTRFPVLLNGILIQDHRGRQFIWSIIEDISERRAAQSALVRHQEMLESMSEQVRIGAWEVDLNSGQYIWSDMIRKIFEVDDGFTLNNDSMLSLLKNDADRLKISESLAHCIETGHPIREEVRAITSSGKTLWIQLTGQAEFKNGTCTRLYGSIQDIDERKRIEKELTTARDNAENAAQAKSAFLATMSHEIRTPMNGVLGMLSLLENSHLDYDQERKVSIAKNSARSLLALIDDVLDFSRVDAGKLALEEIDFNVRELVEELSESLALRAQEKGLELVLDLTDLDNHTVCGDPARLRQIIINLLGNAIKFTDNGEIVIRAALSPANDGWRLHCSVSDTGIGIAESDLPNLFNTFTQIDASTTRKYGGSGLGLSICKKLCELMGGDIRAHSVVGEGSNFSFSLPYRRAHHPRNESLPDYAGRRVLLVDNNRSLRSACRHQLEHWGATMIEAESAEHALSLCERLNKAEGNTPPFDLAIIDRHMPGLDGTELVHFLRQESRFNTVPMVLLGSQNSHGANQHLSELGFDAWFAKPLTTAALREALSLERNNQPSRDTARPTGASANQTSAVQRKVLLVEDNAVNQEVVKCLLEEHGITVETANDGLEALHALNASPAPSGFDLILMDCQMPRMDGYETTRQIRSGGGGESYQRAPIIALTANAMPGDREKCTACGMDDYLSKPIESDSLFAKLQQWLELPVQPQQLEPQQERSQQEKPQQTASKQRMPQPHIPQSQDADLQSTTGMLPPQQTLAIWCEERARDGVMGQQKTLNKLLQLFCDHVQKQLSDLDDAWEEQDLDRVGDLAHAVKGSAGQLQALRLRDTALKLEAAAKDGNTELTGELKDRFESDCQALCQHFREYLEERGHDLAQSA